MIRSTLQLDGSEDTLLRAYLTAKASVIEAGFADEIDWQDDVSFAEIQESDFLREGAWVILSSGMRESVVRRRFPHISEAFLNWASAATIVQQRESCRHRALAIFNHSGKIDAIIDLADQVERAGFDVVRQRVEAEGVRYLRTFPYMGPATSHHLAKNLGLDVVKPDRHLTRISCTLGFESPSGLCNAICRGTGEKRAVVDLVIWRFATLDPGYLEHFAGESAQTAWRERPQFGG